jgi:hypothetical protein
MISGKNLFRTGILLLVMLCGVNAVSAWTLHNWSAKADTSPAQPGTPVTVHYNIYFDSYNTGSTFESSDSLVMYTDLENPQWTVTKTETTDDGSSLITPMPVRQSVQVRIDGWGLSFSRKQFDLNVDLTGTVPATNQSRTITLVKLQELDSGAKLVSGTLIKKELPVSVPTPEPVVTTPVPTPEETILEVTMQQEGTAGTAVPATTKPTRKPTYSPGPGSLITCGILAGLVVLWARTGRRK